MDDPIGHPDLGLPGLEESEIDRDPIRRFSRWLDEAYTQNIWQPNAMTLATVDAGGSPSARVMLLKGHDDRGFVFYTNYESPKGRDLDRNPL